MCLSYTIMPMQYKLGTRVLSQYIGASAGSHHHSSVPTRSNEALRTGYELGHSFRQCRPLKLCHQKTGQHIDILTAAGLFGLTVAFLRVAVRNLLCPSTILTAACSPIWRSLLNPWVGLRSPSFNVSL